MINKIKIDSYKIYKQIMYYKKKMRNLLKNPKYFKMYSYI